DICHRITGTDQTDTSEATRLTSPSPLSVKGERRDTTPNGRSGYYVCPTIARRSLHHSTPTDACYCSMTCAARSSSDGGIVRPSVFAVVKLTTRSNLVGCSTGKSAGLVPLRILSRAVSLRTS